MSYRYLTSAMWHDQKFQALTAEEQRLFLYLLTCPHGNIAGTFVLRTGYAAADLKALPKDLTKALARLTEAGLIAYDQECELVMIVNFLKYNKLTNNNQKKSAADRVMELPKSRILLDFIRRSEVLTQVLPKDYDKALEKALPRGIAIPYSDTYSDTYSELCSGSAEEPDHEPDEEHPGPDEEPDQHPEEPAAPINHDPRPSIMSMHLLNGIRTHKQDFKTPNMKTWEREADLMIRRDGRDPDAAMKLMDWAVADSFWQGNILSMGKFREKYDQLEIQQRRGGNGNGRATDSKATAREAYRGRQTTDYDANVKTLDLGE